MDTVKNITLKGVSVQTSPCDNVGDLLKDFSGGPKALLERGCIKQFGFNPNQTHSLRYSLIPINWSVVGTLTWKNSSRRKGSFDAEKFRRIDFKQVLKKTCVTLKIRLEDTFFYHATEYGKADECHFHFLLFIKSKRVANSLFAKTMEDFWRNSFVPFDSLQAFGGAGTAVITPYDSSKGTAAVDYCLKREFDRHGHERERHDDMSENLFRYLVKKNQILQNN